jgi:hypothetical protein
MNPRPDGLSDDLSCPVDLDYAEPDPVRLAVAPIIARGRRLRRGRRLAAAGLAAAACAAAASIVAGVTDGRLEWFPPPASAAAATELSAAPIDALVAARPPVTGTLTLLARRPAGWTTVAWATRAGSVCWASYRTPSVGATADYQCPGWPASQVLTARRGGLSPLLPGEVGLPGGRLVPEAGLVTPRAIRVQVRFSGREFSAPVVPVPLGGGRNIGVYLIWLRLPPGTSSYGSAGTGPAAAYDAAGHVIARHGPGI